MKIGNLESDGRVVLGPMSGFTSAAYREFMKPFGVAFSISEMTSDSAIVHGTERTSGYVRFGSCPYTGLQLFGHDPETMANAAAIALRDNPNIDFFDVNMSCPVEKVIRSGSGSALMSDPRRCGDIVRAVRGVEPQDLRVSSCRRGIYLAAGGRNYTDHGVVHTVPGVTVNAQIVGLSRCELIRDADRRSWVLTPSPC